MAGFFGVFCDGADRIDCQSLLSLQDHLGLCDSWSLLVDETALFGVSRLRSAPLSEKYLFEDKDWVVAISGDLISVDGKAPTSGIPWNLIVRALDEREYSYFLEWRGMFGICAYNKTLRRVVVINDRKAQWPVFYAHDASGFYVSTELAVFCRLPGMNARLNTDWLYDFLFANVGLFDATFIRGVKSVPPASAVEYDMRTQKLSLEKYAPLYTPKEKLLTGRRGLEQAQAVFQACIPRYFMGAQPVACAMTSGWDSRTLLAFRPEETAVMAYTYGLPGCADLTESARTCRQIDVDHLPIAYDDQMLASLPSMALSTVFSTSGLEQVARSTLSYVYETLTARGTRFPVVISGLEGDMLFRGHGGPISVISRDMSRAFRTNRADISEEPWQTLLEAQYTGFREHVVGRLERLRDTYGPLDSSEHHMSFMLYEISCKKYTGELAVARQFTTQRTPYLDEDLIELAYSIEQSTLSYSVHSSPTDRNKNDNLLFGYLISHTDPRMARIPVRGIPPVVMQRGHAFAQLYRLLVRGPRRLFRRRPAVPLEDWASWFDNQIAELLHELVFHEKAVVREYLNTDKLLDLDVPPAIRRQIVGKVATVGLILTFMESGWRLPGDMQ